MKQVNELLFRAVILSFSALLLVLTLLCSIRLTAERDRVSRLNREIRTAEEECGALRGRYESSRSLAEIERYATQVLGMQHCEAGQLIWLTENEDGGA